MSAIPTRTLETEDRVVEEQAALELEGLGKDYGKVRALGELSLSIQPGEIYGLLGPNGAGKTTALRTILGFVRPSRGRARVFGLDVTKDPVAVREAIGYLPGEVRLDYGPTGGELLEQLGELRPPFDPSYRETLIERFHLDPSKKIKAYSKGNRQKVAIISALQHRPKLALLDEPTSGLDPLMQRTFYEVIEELAESGSAILFSSHVLGEVSATCGRVGVLREGDLVFEKPVVDLAKETLRRVELVFDGPVPQNGDLALPGTVKVERHGDRIIAYVDASPNELVKALSRHRLRDVVLARPDLQDLFMRYYENE
jgi:ABC-2 type transport system ATP-binding protein